MVRLFIVDDHPLFRQGLRGWLSESAGFKVVGEATNAEEAMPKIRSSKPDVVLLDISLPGRSGLDLLTQLHIEIPSINVLIISGLPEKDYAVRCLRAGAMGFVTKDGSPEELLAAVQKVARGRKYVSVSLADELAEEIGGGDVRLPHEALSTREFEVLCCFGRGKTVAQIAELLSLSRPTVSTYRTRILEKMKLETTAQLIQYAVRHGLVDRRD
jgi:DNA-binding NarL/FixJ family response regulator